MAHPRLAAFARFLLALGVFSVELGANAGVLGLLFRGQPLGNFLGFIHGQLTSYSYGISGHDIPGGGVKLVVDDENASPEIIKKANLLIIIGRWILMIK